MAESGAQETGLHAIEGGRGSGAGREGARGERPDDGRRVEFLGELFAGLLDGEWVEIRERPKGVAGMRPRFFPGLEEVLGYHPVPGDAFAGVAPRKGRRGTAEWVSRLQCVWADLDARGRTYDELRLLAQGMPVRPSMVVDSGGGLHLYWLLAAGASLPPERFGEAGALMQRIAARYGGDNVGDAPRILRLPGTLNHKYDPPRPVRLVENNGARYTLEELQALAPPEPPVAQAGALPSSAGAPTASGGGAGKPQLRTENALQGVPEGQRDITIFRLACKLRRAGVPEVMATRLVLETARNCTPPFPLPEAMKKVERAYKRYADGAEEEAELKAERRAEVLGILPEACGAELSDPAKSTAVPESLPFLGQEGYVVRGWSHLVAGYPRCGKTELLVQLCGEWVDRGEQVVYFTEEPRSLWEQRLRRFERDWSRLNVVFALGQDPAVIFQRAFGRSEGIVVVDTMRNLLCLGDETDNTRVAEKLNPWIGAARLNNKTLVIAHHMRKGSGDYGEGIAGGHALLGIFDVALEVTRVDKTAHRRAIRVYARLLSPEPLLYMREDDGTMRALGNPESLALEEVSQRALQVLGGSWLTTADVLDLLGPPHPSLEQLRQGLLHLARQGEVEREPPLGMGVQGKRQTWRLAGAGASPMRLIA